MTLDNAPLVIFGLLAIGSACCLIAAFFHGRR